MGRTYTKFFQIDWIFHSFLCCTYFSVYLSVQWQTWPACQVFHISLWMQVDHPGPENPAQGKQTYSQKRFKDWIQYGKHSQSLYITWKKLTGSPVCESWLSFSCLLLSSSTSRFSCARWLLVQSTPAFSASPILSLISERFFSTKRICSTHSCSKLSLASHAASLKETCNNSGKTMMMRENYWTLTELLSTCKHRMCSLLV